MNEYEQRMMERTFAGTKQNVIDTFNALSEQVNENAVNVGYYEEPKSFSQNISMMHAGLSEAFKNFQKGSGICETWRNEGGRPGGIAAEFAGTIIQILRFCGHFRINIGQAIIDMHEYNKSCEQRKEQIKD